MKAHLRRDIPLMLFLRDLDPTGSHRLDLRVDTWGRPHLCGLEPADWPDRRVDELRGRLVRHRSDDGTLVLQRFSLAFSAEELRSATGPEVLSTTPEYVPKPFFEFIAGPLGQGE